jgi:uncharacterized small protein (DUF1192 family)
MDRDNENELRKPATWAIGEDLSPLSIDELEARIEALKAEIDRIEFAVANKRDSIGVADTFFKR